MNQDLGRFLETTKASYLEAVEKGKANEWTVVTGNEAGDLDSLASAIGYAWFASIQGQKIIPLYQTSRSDLHLRPENLYALKLAGLDISASSILCLSDIPGSSAHPFPSTRLVLVDHNLISPPFKSDTSQVVGIVDHHADEGYHLIADPRVIVVPTGSCASLIANLIHDASPAIESMPPALAVLLLSAIVIDTNGLKVGGKAESIDRAAAAFLVPLASSPLGATLHVTNAISTDPEHQGSAFAQLNEDLQTKKSDVSAFDTRDLLRRDYKQYTFTPSWNTSQTVDVGLASVPIGFRSWYTKATANDAFWREMEAWVDERKLHALGVLTSYRDEEQLNKHGKGKHRREQLWLIPPSAPADLAERLFAGLEVSAELELKQAGFDAHLGADASYGSFETDWKAKVYKQKNTNATRKATAPVVKQIIEGLKEGKL